MANNVLKSKIYDKNNMKITLKRLPEQHIHKKNKLHKIIKKKHIHALLNTIFNNMPIQYYYIILIFIVAYL